MNWLSKTGITVAFIGLSLFTHAQLSAPIFQCTQVDPNGNTTLNWAPISDPSGFFIAYHIFASSGGAFSEIAVIPSINTGSYIDNINNANNLAMCYYIVTEYDMGSGPALSVPSQQKCNVVVSIAASSSPVGYVDVTWSGQPAVNGYVLMWDDPFTNWSNSVNLPSNQNSYSFEVTTCGDLLSFLVFSNQAFCPSISAIEEGYFVDQTPPAIPEITSVSVSNGHPQINWSASTSSDTEGYILYQCQGGGVSIVDTIFGANSTSYLDQNIQSANQSACYLLAAFDNCPNGNPPSPNTSPTGADCNCSVLLAPLSQAQCSNDIALSWTGYQGWTDGVLSYIVYHAEGNGIFLPIDTLAGDALSYTDELQGFTDLNHSYYVIALSSSGNFSVSNVRTITLNYPTPPAYQYISSVDVDLDNTILVRVDAAPTTSLHTLILQQYDEYFESWQNIAYQDNSVMPFTFMVSELKPQYFVYHFRVAVVNECGDTVGYTNAARNLLLEGLVDDDADVNVMKWNDYGKWPSGVFRYEVYRKIGANGIYSLLLTRDSVANNQIDDVDSLYQEDGLFFYRVRAIGWDNDLELDTTFKSWSNEIVMLQTPKVFVPNALMINGVNNTFGPVISFSPLTRYEMFVYSKWGDVIFKSEDYNVRWDGRDEGGDYVPQGVYTYYIRYSKGSDELSSVKGLVTVLYAE
jgi:CHU_C Type IX secretion signal domain